MQKQLSSFIHLPSTKLTQLTKDQVLSFTSFCTTENSTPSEADGSLPNRFKVSSTASKQAINQNIHREKGQLCAPREDVYRRYEVIYLIYRANQGPSSTSTLDLHSVCAIVFWRIIVKPVTFIWDHNLFISYHEIVEYLLDVGLGIGRRSDYVSLSTSHASPSV